MSALRAVSRRLLAGLLAMGLVTGLAALLGACAQTGSSRELATLSDQTGAQKRAQIRLQLAVGYYQQRQLPVALDEVKLALQADPNFADAYGMRALIYMEMGEVQLADENFARAVALAPANPDLANNYGWFLCQHDRGAQAMPYFESAVANRNYQSPAKALNNAGACSLAMGKDRAAERYFLQAFQLNPLDQATSVNLAKMYYARADYVRAQFYSSRMTKVDAADSIAPDVLWLALKIEHKLGNRAAEEALGAQLRRQHANSPAYAAYQRGAFDE